jgi:small subunit ribosomal protein S17
MANNKADPQPPAAASAPVAAEVVTGPEKAHGFRRRLVGKVTSDKMDKTVTVEVIRNARDPVYKKYVRQRERYKAHDETNQYKVGDRVEIMEHRPISRSKRWLVTKLVARPVEE